MLVGIAVGDTWMDTDGASVNVGVDGTGVEVESTFAVGCTDVAEGSTGGVSVGCTGDSVGSTGVSVGFTGVRVGTVCLSESAHGAAHVLELPVPATRTSKVTRTTR